MRLAYADPPYPGQAKRWYRNHPDYGGEVDHVELLRRLDDYDGWALSTSVPALRDLLPLCNPLGQSLRIASWHRSPRVFRPSNIGWCWEPVIFHPARIEGRQYVPDAARFPQLLAPDIPGQKPKLFCEWLFRLLGAEPDDTLDDMFPGSGAVGNAWNAWANQLRLEVAG